MVSSHANHVTMESVYEQMLAPQLAKGDDYQHLESETTGLNCLEEPLRL